MKVLVVDDDYAVLDAMKEILEDEGYDVSVAANGLEAQGVAQAAAAVRHPARPHDAGRERPGVPGETAEDEGLAAIPTIISHSQQAGSQRRGAQGRDLHQKPIAPALLLRTIRTLPSDGLPRRLEDSDRLRTED
jgi:CheY-like chemotaxis protein